MKFLKKLEFGIRQSVELYIPAISFVVMFCLFCYQILVRYVISKFTNLVVPWTTEVEQSCSCGSPCWAPAMSSATRAMWSSPWSTML